MFVGAFDLNKLEWLYLLMGTLGVIAAAIVIRLGRSSAPRRGADITSERQLSLTFFQSSEHLLFRLIGCFSM